MQNDDQVMVVEVMQRYDFKLIKNCTNYGEKVMYAELLKAGKCCWDNCKNGVSP